MGSTSTQRTPSPLCKVHLDRSNAMTVQAIPAKRGILRFTNGHILLPDGTLSSNSGTSSLLVDSDEGVIIDGQACFYEGGLSPDETVDLEGDLLVPGFIDVQINGAYGVDFSDIEEGGSAIDEAKAAQRYLERLDHFAKKIVETGVTSFVPTVITQRSAMYRKILPLLVPRARKGQATCLGWHAEGPFLSPHKKGAHCSELIQSASDGIKSLERTYGAGEGGLGGGAGCVKLITLAPEVDGILEAIPPLVKKGCIVSIGHTACDYNTAFAACSRGARFITHLFNAMGSFNHRDPGVIGLLGDSPSGEQERPYYGLIADGHHSHPSSVMIAYSANPKGCVLVSDAMSWMDPNKPDGVYDWRDGSSVQKTGNKVVLAGTETLAGSVVPLSDCVQNLAKYADLPLHESAVCASANPAKMLRIEGKKGFLKPGADADLVVLDRVTGEVKQTWVAGQLVWIRNRHI